MRFIPVIPIIFCLALNSNFSFSGKYYEPGKLSYMKVLEILEFLGTRISYYDGTRQAVKKHEVLAEGICPRLKNLCESREKQGEKVPAYSTYCTPDEEKVMDTVLVFIFNVNEFKQDEFSELLKEDLRGSCEHGITGITLQIKNQSLE